MLALPPLSAIDSCRIEIFAATPAEPDADVWDTAQWDIPGNDWASGSGGTAVEWVDVTPESTSLIVSWGADSPVGVLTVPAAGSWQIHTYDPERKLDPANGASPYVKSLRPGFPIRVSYLDSVGALHTIRIGLIDEIEYDLSSQIGSLRGTDAVQFLVNAKLLAGQETDANYPNTLYARAAYVLQKAGVSKLVSIEPTPEYDPPVGPVLDREATVWSHILSAAYDALYACWLDRNGTLRFRSFGDPRDFGFQVGGVDGIPIDTIAPFSSLEGVYTHIITYDMGDVDHLVPVEARDQTKIDIYGDILLHRQWNVPNAQIWADSVLADRSGAALEYKSGILRPQTEEQFLLLLDLGMVDIINMVAESVTPSLNVSARLLGGSLMADPESGWSAKVLTYIPAKEWDQIETPPVEPPGEGTPGIVRTFACTKDSVLRHTSSLDSGNGVQNNLPIGYWSSGRIRSVLDFAEIDFSDVVAVEKAELLVTTSTQVCVGYGSNPKVIAKRITAAWNEGSYDETASPCSYAGNNAVKYPGPATTNSGQVTHTMPKGTLKATSIDITEIAKAWLAGESQEGIMLVSAGEDSATYTTELKSRHQSNAGQRPSLKLTVTVA